MFRFNFDEKIDAATMAAALNFLQHLDKNLDKFIKMEPQSPEYKFFTITSFGFGSENLISSNESF